MEQALSLFDLTGSVALVTGGARGIGCAIAGGLASAGAAVVIADLNAAQAEVAAERLRTQGLRASARFVDVTRRETVEQMVGELQQASGQIDILVNCAGILLRKPMAEVSDEDWDAMLGVNLRGMFICAQVVGREMLKRGRGRIINIASNIVQPLQPLRGVYAVSKAGVSQLTRVLALEWAAAGINVNAIAPAPTLTELNRAYFEAHPDDLQQRLRSIPKGRMGQPQDYVGAAIFLASRASEFVTGQTVFVDGGSNLL